MTGVTQMKAFDAKVPKNLGGRYSLSGKNYKCPAEIQQKIISWHKGHVFILLLNHTVPTIPSFLPDYNNSGKITKNNVVTISSNPHDE